ncbi:MAG: DMT family transporter [Bdellovibrio sp.]|nr:DMT family transporter [Bdellovibrio sp.]
MNRKLNSVLEILLADIFWGFGFVATTWSLLSFSLFQSLYLRFTIIAVVTLPFIVYQMNKRDFMKYLKIAFLPSLFLIGEIFFQILGLTYTTPSKAGFITTLFIVIVPILEYLLLKKTISRLHWFWVLLSLIGTYFIVGGEISKINSGDLIIFVSAIFASFHIMTIGKISDLNLDFFKLNIFQSFWGCLLTLPLFFFEPVLEISNIQTKAVIGLMSLTFGTTLLAFYFQMRAQRTISSSTASLLFLLESPLAAVFSFYLIGEQMIWLQILGCLIVILSAIGVIFTSETKKNDPVF